jgi:hypothetical protein
MKSKTKLFAAALAALLASPLLAADDLDEILKKYEAARGGVAAWREAETLSATGTYSSYSHRKPFVLEMRQPSYFYFQTESLGGATLWARDEKGPYWINPAYGNPPWPVRTSQPSIAMMDRLSWFEPALLGAKAKGHQVKLVGRTEIDGIQVIELELTLASGAKEKWFLDASTYLEAVIDATIVDFTQSGDAMNERSFFSDFRKVGKIVIPFNVEKEYKARFSRLEIADLKLGQGWPAEKFRRPIGAGMEYLRPLAGEFVVKVEVPPFRPGQPWREIPATAKVEAHFEGAVLDETFAADFDGNMQTTLRRWSWDRFDELYRIVQNDDESNHPNVFVGKLDGGKITADDVATASGSHRDGPEVLERFKLEVKGPDEIFAEGETSADGGKTWTPAWRMTYTRKK